MPSSPPFSTVFLERIDDIERRALHLKTSLTAICKGIGISRATPDRWRHEIPRTIEIIDQMERWLDQMEKSRQAAEA
jgi:hypothetical protein